MDSWSRRALELASLGCFASDGTEGFAYFWLMSKQSPARKHNATGKNLGELIRALLEFYFMEVCWCGPWHCYSWWQVPFAHFLRLS
jgi:hypothetical protein